MAFTFQINNDVHFNHDKQLLATATAAAPILKMKTITSKRLVSLTKDSSKLGGIWTKPAVDQNLDRPLKKGDSLIIDFGNHYVGHFSLHIDSVGSPMDAPLTLRVKFAEMPVELSQNSADYKGWLSSSWIQEELLHLDVLPTELKLPRRYSFRYVELTVVDTSPKWQVSFSDAQVTAKSSVDPANFEAPKLKDPELQKIYTVGLKTLEDCMQTVFEDGPKRDRRLWLGDLRLQALADYATFDDTQLVKRCLYLFAGMTAEDGRIPANVFTSPADTPDDTFLFDYSLFFVSVLSDLMRHQFDSAVLTDLFPIAKKQMDLALTKVDDQGQLVLDDNYPVFVDWSNDFDKGAAGQAILIYTLKQFIALAQLHGDDSSSYIATLKQLTDFARTSLYDQKAGLFVSGPNREPNIASQVWMTLAAVLPQAETKALMQRTVEKLFPVKNIATPYMYHHVVEALFISGLNDQAVALMKQYWGRMIELGADTFWEAFDPDRPDYSPYGSTLLNSYCHAWSCTPVYLIDQYLLKEG
ncbi:family 78 glycoside hydrolase catalytic domain [Lacticaseibacillus baoqingensis]|uniref:Family 78 glycoside hydrolase catalytic domain n=1 Tax=Lacticaseibacillus baoqingensis TaxID=2486013 RepID=A0ABW4EBJ5_9LACO|nr:family 78 glycoside hydrolase catalytic domain [Lacticaseibacillus baoqingensis]